MAKKTYFIEWTESVTYSAEIKFDPDDPNLSPFEDYWFEIFEANARPDWRQHVDEVEHRELLTMEEH